MVIAPTKGVKKEDEFHDESVLIGVCDGSL